MSPENMSATQGTMAEREWTGDASKIIADLEKQLEKIQKAGTALELSKDDLDTAKEAAQAYMNHVSEVKQREPDREISDELIKKAEMILATEAPSV